MSYRGFISVRVTYITVSGVSTCHLCDAGLQRDIIFIFWVCQIATLHVMCGVCSQARKILRMLINCATYHVYCGYLANSKNKYYIMLKTHITWVTCGNSQNCYVSHPNQDKSPITHELANSHVAVLSLSSSRDIWLAINSSFWAHFVAAQISPHCQHGPLNFCRRPTGFWGDLHAQIFLEFYLFYLKLCDYKLLGKRPKKKGLKKFKPVMYFYWYKA
jgi:hypothetical protein